MDEGTKEELTYYPEMSSWGDDESIKEKSIMNWIKERVKEISTWSGASSLIALGVLIVLGGPFVNLAAYGAIIWGIISVVKKQG